MPCGVTITPLPKFASTAPVLRSNLKIGSTALVSQSTGPPPAPPPAPAPQRSYAQTLPSIGSMSMPAVVPQVRPAGNCPQLRVTFGAGFGNPCPVMGLPVDTGAADGGAAAACSPDPLAPHPAMSSVVQAPTNA